MTDNQNPARQTKMEPVAWRAVGSDGYSDVTERKDIADQWCADGIDVKPLYSHPAPPEKHLNVDLREAAYQALGSLKALGAEKGHASEALRATLGSAPAPQNHLRASILEEAAKVAETGDYYGQFQTAGDERRAKAIAERIRALATTEGQP